MDLPTRLDLFALGSDFARQRAKKLDPAQVNTLGSEVNLFVGGASVIGYAVVKHLAFRTQALLLDGAEGDDLDRLVYDRYGLFRKGASAALGEVRFYRRTFNGGGGSIPIGTRLFTLGGSEYITTSVASFGINDLTSKADVRAVQAGKDTQVGANQIRRFAQVGDLFDSSMQVSNDNATAGGEEREEDEDLRNRVRDYWRTARRGILAAIEFGALTVPGVVSAQAVEALTVGNMPARVINLYIADSSGVASKQLARVVQTALDDYRAAGIAVIINTSLPQLVPIMLKLTFRANVDTVALTDAIRAAIVEYINSLGVNDTLLRGDLQSVLLRFKDDGLIPTADTIVSPVGDLVPTTSQTLRTTLPNVSLAA